MKAAEHTEAMLAGWQEAHVGRADLAVRRACGAMLWHRDLALEGLPLAWARAENAHGAEVYIRPSRGYDWPLVFLDDVPVGTALQVARHYSGLAIQTSAAGGCHLWLPWPQALDEDSKGQVQRELAGMIGADKGSVSGEHLGRLAGFKNWKRGGCWVNVLKVPGDLQPLGLGLLAAQPRPSVRPRMDAGRSVDRKAPGPPLGIAGSLGQDKAPRGDGSPSGQEWGWVCRMLEAGREPTWIYQELVERARGRRGQDVDRSVRRTIAKAMEKVKAGGR